MPVEETVLFIAVIVLALALVVAVVGPKLRAGRRRLDEKPPGESAAVAGARAVGGDPADEVPASLPEPPAALGGAGRPPPTPPQAWAPLVCPTCRRQFAAGLRFCPYDARLLSAEPPAASSAPDRESTADPTLVAPSGKICPTCARRYEMVAVVCARDGAPLVSVN